MSRPARTEIRLLKEEAQGLEFLASEAEVEFSRLEEYWALSLELVALVTDIDDFAVQSPYAERDDPAMIAFRHKLRDLASRLHGMLVD